MQAVTEVFIISHYGNSHLQMRQNPIAIAKYSRHRTDPLKALSSLRVAPYPNATLKFYCLSRVSGLQSMARTPNKTLFPLVWFGLVVWALGSEIQ